MKDGNNNEVDVSVVAHGQTFTYEAIAIDSETGEEKKCVSEPQAEKMFQLLLEGTTMRFVDDDANTGEIHSVALGSNSTSWTNSDIDLGGLVLEPDSDCAAALGEGSGGDRLLRAEDLHDNFIASRQRFVNNHIRKLEVENDSRTLWYSGGYRIGR